MEKRFSFLILLLLKLVLLLIIPKIVVAQQDSSAIRKKMMDSIKAERMDAAALLYPRIRQFTMDHQMNFGGNIHSKLYGQDFFKGKYSSSRTAINMNMPVINNDKNTLILGLGVVHQFIGLKNIDSYDPNNVVADGTSYIPMMNSTLTYNRRDSIFGKQISFTGSLNALFTPSFSKSQFTFAGIVSMPLVRTENSSFMLGMLIIIDPASPFPAAPIFSYFHRFKSAGIDMMLDLPYRIAFRKEIMKKASLTVFGDLSGNNSFPEFDVPNPNLPTKMVFSTSEIRGGMMLEYRLTKKCVFSLSGGVNATIKSNVREQGAKVNDYFIKNSTSAMPFMQVGISLLPFWKGLNL